MLHFSIVRLSEVLDLELLAAQGGELLLAPGLMPGEGAVQALLGIVDAVFELGDRGPEPRAALEVDAADHHIAGALGHAEEIVNVSRNDHGIVLRHNVVDDGQVRAIMEGDALLAVMHIQVIRHHVLAQHEAVAEALRRQIVEDVVVVLIAGSDETRRVAGIGLQFLPLQRIADLLGQAELAVRHMDAGHVLQVHRALGRVHFIVIERHAELQIGDGELGCAEVSLAGISFRRGDNGPRARGGIMLLGRFPVRENAGVVTAHRAEQRGIVVVLYGLHGAHDVGIEQAAGHFALQHDVRAHRRDDQLRAQRPALVLLNGRRSDAVAALGKGEQNLSAAPFRGKVDGCLDRGGIVMDAVTFGAEVKHIDSE